ncbi:MAG: hypothetical protein JXA22_05115 [Candidatus Thermoplasmatota archaeon]|nr:hypothetical protein [Candidatus Thermoplasmatota archaeon]
MKRSIFVLSVIMGILLTTLIQGLAVGNGMEVFGSVEQVGDMYYPRFNHTSTLLSDGSVLVIGGTTDGRSSISECEVYDLDEGWVIAPSLSSPRMRHDAANIPGTDDIIITGGFAGGGHPSLFMHFKGPGNLSLDTSEVYHVGNGTFSKGSDMITGRFWHRSAVTDRGELIIIGGLNVTQGALSSCEVYRNGRWEEFSPLPTPLARFSIVKLADDSLLVAGGHDGTSKTAFSRCFRLADDVWTEVSPMNRGRGYFSGDLLPDGRYLVTGGFSITGQPDLKDGEIYDPEKDRWTLISEMAFPRHNHFTFCLGNEVIVVGGSNCATGGCHSGIEVYDLEKDEWRDAYHVVLGRKWSSALELFNGSILIIGGSACDVPAGRTELFSPPPDHKDEVSKIGITLRVSIGIVLSLVLLWVLSWLPSVERRTGGKMKHAMPHISTLVLGGILMILADPLLLPIYVLIVMLTMFWFWASICTHCRGWRSGSCPSGYGRISSKLFRKAKEPQFGRAFRRNIWTVALQWFVPLVVAVAYLIFEFDIYLLVALLMFILAGFVVLPLASSKKGCNECPQKGECPFRRN